MARSNLYFVPSARFFVLVNGSPKGYFHNSRGLRQGDPLSPILFVIVVEALQVLLDVAIQRMLILVFAIENSILEVSHLQFADDSYFLVLS